MYIVLINTSETSQLFLLVAKERTERNDLPKFRESWDLNTCLLLSSQVQNLYFMVHYSPDKNQVRLGLHCREGEQQENQSSCSKEWGHSLDIPWTKKLFFWHLLPWTPAMSELVTRRSHLKRVCSKLLARQCMLPNGTRVDITWSGGKLCSSCRMLLQYWVCQWWQAQVTQSPQVCGRCSTRLRCTASSTSNGWVPASRKVRSTNLGSLLGSEWPRGKIIQCPPPPGK